MKTVNDMLSELLITYGFGQMAKDVLEETDKKRLSRYAQVIVRAENRENRMDYGTKLKLVNGFKLLGLC